MAEIMHKTGFHGFNNSDSHTQATEENKFTCLSFLNSRFLKKLPPFENVFKGNRTDIFSWHKYWYGQNFNVFYHTHYPYSTSYFLDFYYCIFVMQIFLYISEGVQMKHWINGLPHAKMDDKQSTLSR